MEHPRIASAVQGLRHVFIRDLVLLASIGIHPQEQAVLQRVRINVDLGVQDDGVRPLSRAAIFCASKNCRKSPPLFLTC